MNLRNRIAMASVALAMTAAVGLFLSREQAVKEPPVHEAIATVSPAPMPAPTAARPVGEDPERLEALRHPPQNVNELLDQIGRGHDTGDALKNLLAKAPEATREKAARLEREGQELDDELDKLRDLQRRIDRERREKRDVTALDAERKALVDHLTAEQSRLHYETMELVTTLSRVLEESALATN